VAAALAALAGVVNLVSALLPAEADRLQVLDALVPGIVSEGATVITAAAGIGLLLLAGGLRRRQRLAWLAALVLLGGSAVLNLTKGLDVEEALLELCLAGLLAAQAGQFNARQGPLERRPVLGPALLVVLVAGAYATLGLLANAGAVAGPLPVGRALQEAGRMAVGLGSGLELEGRFGRFFPASVAAVFYLGGLVVAARVLAPALVRPGRDPDLARAVAASGDSLAYFALRDDRLSVRGGDSLVSWAPVGVVALAAGDPLGPPAHWPAAVAAFLGQATAQGRIAATLGCGTQGAHAYRAAGLACIYLGDEAVLDLERFSLEGRARRIARQSWHRARRAGLTATVCRVAELDPGQRAALHALAARWRGAAPERGFSMALGRLLDPRDPGGFLVVGRAAGGRLLGFLHLVPWGDDGASLDVMRRERDAPAIINDFLVVEAARRLPALGVRRLSLNFAFQRAVLEAGAGRHIPWRARTARWALCRLTRPFPVETLYRFNKKFAPAWQPRYLAIQAPEDLPTVAVACLKAEGLLARSSRRSPGVRWPSARRAALSAMLALALVVAGCTLRESGRGPGRPPAGQVASTIAAADPGTGAPVRWDPASTGALPGMPTVLDPHDVYAATRPGRLSPVVRRFPALVYVPNSGDGTVDVIDPRRFRRVRRFRVGRQPQHVTPSWDLRTLWVGNDQGSSLTAIDPATGRPGRTVRVADPYNLYFTPDGRRAIVVAERLRRLDFRDPHTMRLRHSLSVPCFGVDHLDFSADGRSLLASCEFSGHLVRVDVASERVTGLLRLRPGAVPQDVKLAPDGRVYYVADMAYGGVWIIDATRPRVVGFVPTGRGAHGLYASRDSRVLYVSNRGEGSISLISFATRKVVAIWRLPGGGSPDMGGVSADGKVLWLAGRYDGEVYAIDTSSGRLLARVPVGQGPHGLCVYPQPGRYSLGHTGVFR
jgi:lysylphosphatidylglycerol synthetase-like protein (DUF2156 family)/DNA-binding beta-propeller fold protein YncE